jgi:hypothetical protein
LEPRINIISKLSYTNGINSPPGSTLENVVLLHAGARYAAAKCMPLKHHDVPVHFTLYSDMILLSIEAIFAVL